MTVSRKIIGVPEDRQYVKATDFFDAKGQNKLAPFLQEAFATNTPNKFQQDFKDAYFRLSLLDRALSGEIIKIFPLLNDENNKWISALEFRSGQYQVSDSLYANFIQNAVPYYLYRCKNHRSAEIIHNLISYLRPFIRIKKIMAARYYLQIQG